jgi:hypothetical protein
MTCKIDMCVIDIQMRILWIALLLGGVLTLPARADTTFVAAGNVNGTWSLTGSPYVVQGNLTVAGSDSLIVDAGVRVYFSSTYSLLVNGFMEVDGAEGDTVVFTTDTVANSDKWRGLSFVNAHDSSRVRYARFENSFAPGPTGPDSLGGAIYISSGSVVRLEHCMFKNNRAELAGGAVYVTGATLWMDSCRFDRNASRAEGAGLFLNNTIGSTISNTRFFKNSSTNGSGGGAYVRGTTPLLTHCVFDSNYARVNGGGLMFKNCFGRLDSSTISRNQGRGHGGGIAIENSSPEIFDCLIDHNWTQDFDGGGVYVWESSPHMLRCQVLLNISADDGGGIHSYRETSNGLFEYCEVRGNVCAGQGAGIWVTLDGAPTFRNCLVKENTAGLYGGAVFLRSNARPTFTNCEFDSNTSLGNGGGLSIRQSQPVLTDCKVRNNYATDEGGGVHLWEAADAVFKECEISENHAALNGGGISSNQSALVAENCLITGNSTDALGGGIATANSSKLTLRHCTIGGNSNGALRLESTVADIENSVLSTLSGNGLYFAAAEDSRIAYSLVQGPVVFAGEDPLQGPEFIASTCAVNSNGDSCDTYFNVYADPQFVDAGNGEWELGSESPAIGAGNWNTSTSDLYGNDRPMPLLTLPDMGAIESAFGNAPSGLFGLLGGTIGPDTLKVVADILVDTLDQLNILPGTTLIFCGPSGMTVHGVVTAQGMSTDSITFTTDTTINPGLWRGITMDVNAGASQFEFVSLSDSRALTTSRTRGGAMHLQNVSPSFANCSVSRHSAQQGGAIYLDHSSPIFTECFLANSSADSGGVICARTSSNPVFDGCVIAGGNAAAGGGILIQGATGQVLNSRIEGNTASATGGGIMLDTAPTLLRNNLILSNSAPAGGGVWTGSTSATLQFNSVAGNTAAQGAGLYIRFGSSQIKNNIVAENHGHGVFFFVTTSSVVRYNCVATNDSANFGFFGNSPSQGPTGIGALDSLNYNGDPCDRYYNIQLDPEWVSGTGYDYYLAHAATGEFEDSPCINAGDTLVAAPVATTTRTDFIVDNNRPDQGYHGPQLGAPLPAVDDLVIRANADTFYLHWSYAQPALFTIKTDSSLSGSFLTTVAVTTDTFAIIPPGPSVHPQKGFFHILAEPQP